MVSSCALFNSGQPTGFLGFTVSLDTEIMVGLMSGEPLSHLFRDDFSLLSSWNSDFYLKQFSISNRLTCHEPYLSEFQLFKAFWLLSCFFLPTIFLLIKHICLNGMSSSTSYFDKWVCYLYSKKYKVIRYSDQLNKYKLVNDFIRFICGNCQRCGNLCSKYL